MRTCTFHAMGTCTFPEELNLTTPVKRADLGREEHCLTLKHIKAASNQITSNGPHLHPLAFHTDYPRHTQILMDGLWHSHCQVLSISYFISKE